MRKLNTVFFSSVIFIFLGFAVIISFAGCKSMPAGRPVNPVELLDGDNDIYIAIPKSADPEFIKAIIQKSVPGLSDSNIKMILDRTSNFFCGLKIHGNSVSVQAVIEGNVPVKLLGSVLNRKNGWQIRNFKSGTAIDHVVYCSNGIELSFPSGNLACIGSNIEGMLGRYNMLAYSYDNMLSAPVMDNMDNSELPGDVVTFLYDPGLEMRFYAKNPLAFLTMLTGLSLNLKLVDVKGGCVVNAENPEKYVFDIYLNFEEKKYLKAGRALLSLAAGILRSQTEIINDTGLKITGIEFDRKLLYKLFEL